VIESELAMSAIAMRTGYADQPHFTRCFRAATGVTPLRYRRRFRQQSGNVNQAFKRGDGVTVNARL
jgi:transcriptional regulator GlxA family with amidase domain